MSNEKMEFVRGQFRADPAVSQFKLTNEVKTRFGKGLAFGAIKKLREAHAAGTFDAAWRELFGAEEAAAATAAPQAAPAPAPAEPAAVPQPAGRQPKQRGERRSKIEKRGRRRADRSLILLEDFAEHLVVYRVQGVLQQATFKSRDRAEEKVKELLAAGTPATDLAYYKQSSMGAKITISI
jgi:hypothetical protein